MESLISFFRYIFMDLYSIKNAETSIIKSNNNKPPIDMVTRQAFKKAGEDKLAENSEEASDGSIWFG